MTNTPPTHPSRLARSTRLVIHQTRYDGLSFLRNRQSRVFTIALPVLFLIIFCGVFGNGSVRIAGGRIQESTYYVPGLVAFGVISASFINLVISVTAQRESGILKRRRATPVPAWVLIAGRGLTAFLTAATTATVLIAIGVVAYGARVPERTIPAIILAVAVGALSFVALSYALVTAIGSADSAQPTVQLVMLPLFFISGVFIPTAVIPHWLSTVADVFPVRHLAHALLSAFSPYTTGAGIAWGDLGILAAWGAAGLVIALLRFSWQPRTA